eukprot:TRINITY_DN40022_c0_g3_i1.p1 TRINITY_DN40022_c0_g3~~TRINITY_DN40022_c0_g3_i1.p1  ORF type:complete len:614 (+),score=127.44 TRINITY_DN40022_c0_g3_i1:113-1843(+)
MTKHLPKFLTGLLHMLNDLHKDIRQNAEATLASFLQKACVKESWNNEGYGKVWLTEIINILIGEARSMHAPNEQMIVGSEAEGELRDLGMAQNPSRLTSIQWVNEFVMTGGTQFIEDFPDIIDVSLVSLSDKDSSISSQGQILGRNLLQIMKTPVEPSGRVVDVRRFIEAVEIHLIATVDVVRVCAAEWLIVLIKRWPAEMSAELQTYFVSILQLLSDDALEVAGTGVEILATIAQIDEKKFVMIFNQLVHLLYKDSKLAQEGTDMIVLRLIDHLGAAQVYTAFCQQLETCDGSSLESCQLIVQSLSKLLITAKVTESIRMELITVVTGVGENKQAKNLFKTLYYCFCYDAVAVISLCLVAECFELGSELIAHFDEVEVTASFLIQVHLFVKMLETPLFLDLRLRLLEPSEHPHLLKIMYGLLMVLPQNDAFHSLLQRLEKGTAITLFNHQIAQFDSEGNPIPSQPILSKSSLVSRAVSREAKVLDIGALVAEFENKQRKISQSRLQVLRDASLLPKSVAKKRVVGAGPPSNSRKAADRQIVKPDAELPRPGTVSKFIKNLQATQYLPSQFYQSRL